MKTIAASIALLASIAHAQYSGFIFFTEGECPKLQADETQQLLTWQSGTNMCADISGNCPEGICNIAVSATQTGYMADMPAKIGACPGSDCSADCKTWDVEQGVNGFRVDCAEFTGQWYFYLGN